MVNKYLSLLFLFVFSFQISCSSSKADDRRNEVTEFLNLLVSNEIAYLSDFQKFYGESSEQELTFELMKCGDMGWDKNSNNCISYIRDRWESPDTVKSLFISWLKSRFNTSGEEYRIIKYSKSEEGIDHELVEVLIGEYKFTLFHNVSNEKYTGLSVAVSFVNDLSVSSYLAEISGIR